MAQIFYDAMVLREPYSGVEVAVHALAEALSRFGTLPMTCCAPRGYRPIPTRPGAPAFRVRAAPRATGESRLLRILWEQTVLPVLLARSRAALLHAPAYVSPILAPCPTVLTVHDLHALTHPQFCLWSNRLHYRLLLPRSVRKAAAVIVFSEYTRRNVADAFPGAAGKLRVIPPGVSGCFRRVTDPALLRKARLRYGLPASFLLFVGDLSARKNLAGLIRAFARVQGERPDLHLVLAGAPGRDAAALDGEIRRQGVRHRVCRTGYVAPGDLPALYSSARAFVFLSHDEGFGLPPLEAMACGCPVVCSGGAPLEICGDAAVACSPEDTLSVANAIRGLLDNPDFRNRQIERGYRKAAVFTWEKTVRETESVYLEAKGK